MPCLLFDKHENICTLQHSLLPAIRRLRQIFNSLQTWHFLHSVTFSRWNIHMYVYGRHVTIETDHRPLIAIVKKAAYYCDCNVTTLTCRCTNQRRRSSSPTRSVARILRTRQSRRRSPQKLLPLVDVEQSNELQIIASTQTVQLTTNRFSSRRWSLPATASTNSTLLARTNSWRAAWNCTNITLSPMSWLTAEISSIRDRAL